MTIQKHESVPTDLAVRVDYAQAVASAPILPDAFKRQPANILIAMEVADALGKRPFMVMQELAIISGKPSFSAKFMRGLVREAGHRLRESFDDGTATCEIVRKDDPEFSHVAKWDEAKARQHDYWGKGHWKKNPELMLKNRALSECVREACPEVLGGVAYTPDEVEDFAPKATVRQVHPAPKEKPPTAAEIMADEADTISHEQTQTLAGLLKEQGISRDEALSFAIGVVGHELKSAAALTRDEADRVITALSQDGQQVDAATGEVVDAEVVPDGDQAEPEGW